jgi:glycerol uptake facilitator-like aquaporin
MQNEAKPLIEKNNQEMALNNSKNKLEKVIPETNYTTIIFQAIFEMIATFMFVCCIYYCRGDVNKFIFGMWVILVLFGRFSGAHVNPAITLAFYIYEANYYAGLIKMLLYWTGQFLGAFIGALIASQFYKNAVSVSVPIEKGVFEVMYSEFFFTGTFAFTILYVCSQITHPSKNAPMNCAIIVGWFFLIVNAGSTISGAAYNPAVLTVLNVLAASQNAKALHYVIYMIIAQLVGATLFTFIFKYVFESFIKNKNERKEE